MRVINSYFIFLDIFLLHFHNHSSPPPPSETLYYTIKSTPRPQNTPKVSLSFPKLHNRYGQMTSTRSVISR